MYLCLSHTSREVDFSLCSLNYLTRRYSSPSRLKALPSLESLDDGFCAEYTGDITVWEFKGSVMDPPVLRAYIKKNYKAQNAVILGATLIVCGTTFLELIDLKRNAIRQISHPWFAGGHTVYPAPDERLVVSCSGSDALLVLNSNTGELIKALRMPEEIYGHNYDLKPEDDLRKHYVNNDLQTTHINSAYPCEKGYLVSALIPGAIGLFGWNGAYTEIVSGFIGCHGARTRPGLDGFYFSDSCTGLLFEMDWNGNVLRRFSVESKWLHDCEWVEDDLYLFSLSDVNALQLWDIAKGTKVWEIGMSAYGKSTQFSAIHVNKVEEGLFDATRTGFGGRSTTLPLMDPIYDGKDGQKELELNEESAARAYWDNRSILEEIQNVIVLLHKTVGYPNHFTLSQYAQFISMAMAAKPDLILEIGRWEGHSTCAFTQAANVLSDVQKCKVISVCGSNAWDQITEANLRQSMPESWFDPLTIITREPPESEIESVLAGSTRVLLSWRDPRFAVSKWVINRILPILASQSHLVMVSYIYDERYSDPRVNNYSGGDWWRTGQLSNGTMRLGHFYGDAALLIPLIDFLSRNKIDLYSSDHSLASKLDQLQKLEMQSILGKGETNIVSQLGYWTYFSLNTGNPPFIFPTDDSL